MPGSLLNWQKVEQCGKGRACDEMCSRAEGGKSRGAEVKISTDIRTGKSGQRTVVGRRECRGKSSRRSKRVCRLIEE